MLSIGQAFTLLYTQPLQQLRCVIPFDPVQTGPTTHAPADSCLDAYTVVGIRTALHSAPSIPLPFLYENTFFFWLTNRSTSEDITMSDGANALAELKALANLIQSNVDRIKATAASESLEFPSLWTTFSPQSEAARQSPDIADATAQIVAAASQLIAAVRPPPLTVMSLGLSFYIPASLRVVVDAHVAEFLRDAGSAGAHVTEIAKLTNIDPSKLARILRLLVTYHIFVEVSPDVFANNRLSSFLDSGKAVQALVTYPEQMYDGTSGITAVLGHFGDESFKAAAYLADAISDPAMSHSYESNKSAANKAFNTDLELFSWYETPGNESRLRRVGHAMNGSQALSPPNAILEGFDWKGLKEGALVVDVGGGVGSQSLVLANHFSHLHFIVQDRNAVVPEAEKQARLYQASVTSYLGDINMLTLCNGQERTATHLRNLLAQTGWKLVEVRREPGPALSFQNAIAVPVTVLQQNNDESNNGRSIAATKAVSLGLSQYILARSADVTRNISASGESRSTALQNSSRTFSGGHEFSASAALSVGEPALAVIAAVTAVKLPVEIKEFTGLSNAQVRSLIDPSMSLDARATDCPPNIMSGGVFAGPGAPTPEGLLKRNSFVTRQGTKLKLLGKDFRVVGANIYWLGLDENVIPNPSYPSKARVLEAFADVSVMHGTTVRGHTLGISVGNPLSVEPSLDVFNNEAYEAIDFAILAARIYGIKLLIPLVDNYNYYHGGKYQFISWNGHPFNGTGANIEPPDVGAFFYNDTQVVSSFKRYVTNHLTHVNRYTGIALKDDPIILGWESGNELAAVRFGDGPAPASWTKEIGQLVKRLAPRQLFMDGSYGIYPDTDQLDTKEVDILCVFPGSVCMNGGSDPSSPPSGDHFYPANISKLTTGMDLVNKAGRNYLAGEYDWTGLNGGDTIESFLSVVTKSAGAGDTFWSLFGHDDGCCQYVEHDDGESFYYLRENDTVPYISQGKILVEHAAQITVQKVPTGFQAVACPQYKFSSSLIPHGINL
ncbi:hypothetical protein EVG20_g1114 [Dentipellis fragilis]|uniref:Glycoside hydrolase family 5 domain-containing protein n=1 Tax=Dentipellis fragilis TaxID=205917 RepID=A0A4Y9ZDJ9_9AGAM|nr:hypothetical protein EVG20_g1114 [Dentipellis fragilis]